ncbi:MAG: hypothetical protein KF841_08710 [Phycisphaerae bacterium]|nr:hypothetical protein [Phycisphaerae bacterium]
MARIELENAKGDCGEVRAGLDDWLDGALDEAALGKIDMHCANCPACRDWFERHHRIAGDLELLGSVADRILQKAPAAAPPRKTTPIAWRIAALVAMAVGAVFAARAIWKAPMSQPTAIGPIETPASHPVNLASSAGPASRRGVSIDPGEGRFAVSIPSNDPTIRIVWLYDDRNARLKIHEP